MQVGIILFLAHLSQRYYDYSLSVENAENLSIHLSVLFCPSICPFTPTSPLKPLGQISSNHVEPSVKGGLKIYTNGHNP